MKLGKKGSLGKGLKTAFKRLSLQSRRPTQAASAQLPTIQKFRLVDDVFLEILSLCDLSSLISASQV
jgi:hypothetical protein